MRRDRKVDVRCPIKLDWRQVRCTKLVRPVISALNRFACGDALEALGSRTESTLLAVWRAFKVREPEYACWFVKRYKRQQRTFNRFLMKRGRVRALAELDDRAFVRQMRRKLRV